MSARGGFAFGEKPAPIDGMKDIKTIFWREFRSYFNSPVAYIVIIAWLLLSSWFFTSNLFLANQASISGFFDLAPLFFLFIIPAVTMRLIAEEEKLGTSEILSTMPLLDWKVIAGKYLSALALLGIGIACTLIYPISVAFVGPIDWGEVIGSYIGLLLLAGGFSAIGIFTSSITKSQIIAFILSIVVCFVFFILGKILGIVPTSIVSIFQFFGIDYHLDSLGRGVIDSRNVIYFFSMITFFLCFAFYFYRKAKHRVRSGLSIGIVLAIIVVVNFLSYRLFLRTDLTQGNIYSLSKSSVKIIRRLEDPVIIRAYITQALPFPYNTRSKYTKDLLSEYATKSRGRVKFELIDPKEQGQKQEAQRSGIYPLKFTEIKESEFGVKEGFMGLIFMHGDKKEIIPVIENIATLEYDITSRIKKLTSKVQKVIAFTTGHNEVELPDVLQEEIGKRFEYKTINLDTAELTPDISSLVIVGPKTEYRDTAIQKIKTFMESGARGATSKTCGFFLDKYSVNLQFFLAFPVKTGLDDLLASYGITLKQGLVMDYQNQVIGLTMQRGGFRMQNLVPYPFFPKAMDLNKSNSMVRELESIILPFTTAIEGGTAIVKSSKRSWLRENVQNVNPMDQQALYTPLPFEKKGPFALVSLSEKPRFIVVGTSKLVEANYGSPQNLAFFLNAMDWLAQDEELIAIRSKGVQDRPLRPVSKGIKRTITWLDTLLPSIILLCVGFIRWQIRNRRTYEVI